MPSHTYALDATWRPILKDLGISATNVLRRAGLAEDLLARPAVRLSSAEFYRFWEGMQAESGDPLFPLLLCRAIRSESFSPPLFAALCSPNFLVAAHRIARYKTLVAPMRLEVREEGGTVTLELIWLERELPPPPSLVTTELLFFVGLARLGSREEVRPLRVSTLDPPRPGDAFTAFLGVPVERAAAHRITFRRSDAERPFLTSNEGVWTAFEPELRMRLANVEASDTTAQRVRAALLEALPSGLVAMEAVARKLAVSTRTLQRRLEAEGTTYGALVRRTRETLARHYLQHTALPISDIAFLLGFGEASSFHRAFREWTGVTPEHLRRQVAATTAPPGTPPRTTAR